MKLTKEAQDYYGEENVPDNYYCTKDDSSLEGITDACCFCGGGEIVTPVIEEIPDLVPTDDYNWVEYFTAIYVWAARGLGWHASNAGVEVERMAETDEYETYEPSTGYGYIKKIKAIKGATYNWDWSYFAIHQLYLLIICTLLDHGFEQCTENVWADLELAGHPSGINKYFNLYTWSGWGELMLWKLVSDFWFGKLWGAAAMGSAAAIYFFTASEDLSMPFCVEGDLQLFGYDCASYSFLSYQ